MCHNEPAMIQIAVHPLQFKVQLAVPGFTATSDLCLGVSRVGLAWPLNWEGTCCNS